MRESLLLVGDICRARTRHGDQAGLQCARFCWHGWVGSLHGHRLLGAGAGDDIWRLPLALQSLLDGGGVRRQVGQLMEHVAFPDDGVNQVAVSW